MKKYLFMIILTLSFMSLAKENTQEKSKKPSYGAVVVVKVDKKGFTSEKPLHFKKGENIILDVTRITDKTCMTEIQHPKTGNLVKLPLNKKTRIDLGSYSEPKEIRLLCGMNMTAGVIYIE